MANDARLSGHGVGHRRDRPAPGPPARRPERAQQVWARAVHLAGMAGLAGGPDRFSIALDLLRAAHNDPDTLAHGLTLGRSHLVDHPDDAAATTGASMLDEAIAFLGTKPPRGRR